MKKLAKNLMAVGLVTLIITAALSFSAQAADDYEYTSYAEAQYIAATGILLGDVLVDPLADFLEGGDLGVDDNSAGAAAQVDTANGTPETDGPYFTSSPLDPLAGLTGPVGDLLGSGGVSAVSGYAIAAKDASTAASGAVNDQGGIVDVDTIPDAQKPGFGQLSLTGTGSPLAALNGLANATLSIGAVGSSVELAENAPSAPIRDFDVAGGTLTLEVPALGTIINTVDLADDLANISVAGLATISGLDGVVNAITNVTKDGVTLDLNAGTISVDIDGVVFAATGQHINELPHNTAIVPTVVQGVLDTLPGLLTDISNQLVTAVGAVQVTILGGAFDLGIVTGLVKAAINGLLTPVVSTLTTALSPAIAPLFEALEPLIDIRVNVWETDPGSYASIIADRLPATGDIFSVTALRVSLLSAAGADPALAINLGNSLVGPNSRTAVPVADNDNAVADNDNAVADNDNAVADNDNAVADNDNAVADNDNAVADDNGNDQANAEAAADSDAQADADVTTTLPGTGAPNLMPFWMLGLGLLLFGGAVLLNEKRRLSN